MKRENKRKSNEYPTRQNVRNVNKRRISALSKEIVRALTVQRHNGKRQKNKKKNNCFQRYRCEKRVLCQKNILEYRSVVPP